MIFLRASKDYFSLKNLFKVVVVGAVETVENSVSSLVLLGYSHF